MSTLILFKIILSVYITNQHASALAVEPLILSGDAVRIEDYPFYAGLDNCGAIILSNTWILTAAHCVEDVDIRQRNYVWVGGETYANSLQVPYNYVHVHEEYQGCVGHYNHDIALIKLSKPLKFTKKIQPIKLPNGPTLNSNITFVGRGRDETGLTSKTLKKVDLIKLSIVECIKLIQPYDRVYILQILKLLQTSDICTKREGNKPSLCDGDSGSPLISGDTIIGVASFGTKAECENSKLTFFVNVTSYVPWIKGITGL